MFNVSGLSNEKRGIRWALSSQRPVLTLQHEDLSNQHLRIHQLREQIHGSVHQVGTKDGEELLPDCFSLLPSAGIRLCPKRRLPAGELPWLAADRQRRSPEWDRPELLLLVAAGSAALEICRLTVWTHAGWVRTIAGVRWRAVHVRAVAADGPEAVLLAVESWSGALRRRAMRAAAARCTSGRAVLRSYTLGVMWATIYHPIVVITPRSLQRLTIYGAQTRIQLLLRAAVPHGAVVWRVLARLLLSRCFLARAVARLPRSHVFIFIIFLALWGATVVTQRQFLCHILDQQEALSRHRTGVNRRVLSILAKLIGNQVIGLLESLRVVEFTFNSICAFPSWKRKKKAESFSSANGVW